MLIIHDNYNQISLHFLENLGLKLLFVNGEIIFMMKNYFQKISKGILLLTFSIGISCSTPSSSQPQQGGNVSEKLKDGLVAYYSFEGNANDLSGNNHNGTPTGKVTFESGKIGKALKLDQEGDTESYVMVKNSPKITFSKNFTISAWAYFQSSEPDLGDSYFSVLTKGKVKEDYTLWLTSTGPDILLNWDTENQLWPYLGGKEKNVTPNTWNYLSATYDGKMVTLYLNGTMASSYTYDKNIDANNEDLFIGISFPGGIEKFPGMIDELRLYNRALPANEIKMLYDLK